MCSTGKSFHSFSHQTGRWRIKAGRARRSRQTCALHERRDLKSTLHTGHGLCQSRYTEEELNAISSLLWRSFVLSCFGPSPLQEFPPCLLLKWGNKNNGFFRKKEKAPHVMWRDAMVYEHAAPRCTGLTKMPPPASSYAFCIFRRRKKSFSLCNECKINKFINKLKNNLYCSVCVRANHQVHPP